MTFAAIRTGLLFLLGVTTTETPPPAAAQDAADALNRAMQTLWLGGEDYFTREKLSVPVTAGAAQVVLDPDVQSVLTPIYDEATSRPLRVLSNRSDYDLYPVLYQRYGSGATIPPGPPAACYVERLRGADATAPVTINLLLRPVPAAGTTLEVAAIRRPLSYTAAQFSPGVNPAPPDPPVPDAYAETLLLPLTRSFLLSSRYFSETDRAPAYLADAQRALAALGLADPAPPALASADAKARATTAARQAARTAYKSSLAGEAANP